MGNAACCFQSKLQRHLSVDLQISTWSKMHNLYDHLGAELKTFYTFSTQKDSIFLRYLNQWKAFTSMSQLSSIDRTKVECYFDISKELGHFTMFNNIIPNEGLRDDAIWKVIDDQDQLKVNDVIKLGRSRFKLIDMVICPEPFEQNSKDEIQTQNSCKICYQKTESANNPLVSPCDCSGTMKYIHLQCLRHWVARTGKIISTDNIAEIPSKDISCQLCGKIYQPIITHNQRNYCILYDSTTIKPPYIQLNLIQKTSNHSKTSYIISFRNKNIVHIGRGTNCQIQPKQDIALSRLHVQLYLKDEGLYVRNCDSKFGTLKLITRPQEIVNLPITKKYQVANNLIQLQIRYSQNTVPPEEPDVKEIRSMRESLAVSRISTKGIQYNPISTIQISEVQI